LEIASASQSGSKSELQEVWDRLEEENKSLHQKLTESDEKSVLKEKQQSD
jgi:hypothetical protein